MRSRTVREGSVGLMILAGLGLFAGLILWLRGLNPGNRSFKVFVEFATTAGIQSGAPVRYRGVQVGRVKGIRPGPNGVEVELQISPASLVIPVDSEVTINQSGLLGETALDIAPLKNLATDTVASRPLDRNCNSNQILCDGARLKGQIGISTDELIRSSIKFANLYGDPQFFGNVNNLTKNTAQAAAEIAQLSRDFSVLAKSARQELGTVSTTLQAVGGAANQFGLTATQLNSLLVNNRSTLVLTLNNLSAISTDLRTTVARLGPVLDRVQQGELLRNLEILSANAAQASTNLRDVSQALNNPTNLTVLQQTLDSARATFQNTQKITSDLDELTGDPRFRTNLKNLVNGLSNLVSSTKDLQQQAQLAQVLSPMAERANQSPPVVFPSPAPATLPPTPIPPVVDKTPMAEATPASPRGSY